MSLPGDGLPSDLIDYLIKLITNGPDDWGLGREVWPQIIPPSWRPYLSPGDEINRRLGQAESAVRQAGRDAARAAYARARLIALDQLVGRTCLAAAALFAATGHADAAMLLREFVNATGPQTRTFTHDSAFSLGFARSETTTPSIARALQLWKTRPGGVRANNGTIVRLGSSFVPLALSLRLAPMPGPDVRVIGSPEAHVIGSFGYQGQLIGDDIAEWRAINDLSLKSYFAENWTSRVNISLVDDNRRPDRYGNTRQIIYWRTTMDGMVLG